MYSSSSSAGKNPSSVANANEWVNFHERLSYYELHADRYINNLFMWLHNHSHLPPPIRRLGMLRKTFTFKLLLGGLHLIRHSFMQYFSANPQPPKMQSVCSWVLSVTMCFYDASIHCKLRVQYLPRYVGTYICVCRARSERFQALASTSSWLFSCHSNSCLTLAQLQCAPRTTKKCITKVRVASEALMYNKCRKNSKVPADRCNLGWAASGHGRMEICYAALTKW